MFLRDGVVPPDNNVAERVLRRNAILRKNRLFYVGKDSGQYIGTLLSLMVSCRELDLQPHHYLNWSLPALLDFRNGKAVDLTNWTPLAYSKASENNAHCRLVESRRVKLTDTAYKPESHTLYRRALPFRPPMGPYPLPWTGLSHYAKLGACPG